MDVFEIVMMIVAIAGAFSFTSMTICLLIEEIKSIKGDDYY